jgi:hypothetical protein
MKKLLVHAHTHPLLGTSILSPKFNYLLHISDTPFRNNCYLHQLGSIVFLLQQYPTYFSNHNVHVFTNLPKSINYFDDTPDFNPLFVTLFILSNRYNCSFDFHYSHQLVNPVLNSQPTLYKRNNYLTLYNGEKFHLSSFFIN